MLLHPDRPPGKILTGLLDLLVLQLCFLLTSIPVFTIGAGLTAMFSVCRKLQQNSVGSIIKTYFSEFKAGFGKSTLSWFLITVPAVLLAMAVSYYYRMEGILWLAFLIIGCILLLLVCMAFVYVFPLIAWFDNSLRGHFRNALMLAVFHIKTTVLVILLYLFVFLVVVPVLPVTLFIAFSGSAFYANLLFTKVFAKHEPAAAPPESIPEP